METITEDGEIISGLPAERVQDTSLAVALSRSEIDQQVTTARALPRSVKRAVENILSLATLDEQASQECIYALPRSGKPIKGPSVRLAEIISGQWGNCRVGARVVHVDRTEKFVEAEGVFHDLETNTATTARVRRRISDKNGRLLNDDMIVVTGNAACSIAKRNAILAGVPKPVWRKAYEAAEHVVAGDITTLAVRRENALKAFAAFGVKPEQVFAALGVLGLDDVTLEHIPTLTGMYSALKNGEATVEEMFDPRRTASGKAFERVSNPLADEPEKKPEPTSVAEPEPAPAEPAPAAQAVDPSAEQPDPDAEAEAIAEADADGFAARQKGMSRKSVPTRFKGSRTLSEAWWKGYDAAAKEEESA